MPQDRIGQWPPVRLIQCLRLELHLPNKVLAISPFVPPVQGIRAQAADIALPGTMASSVHQAANGPTNARSAQSCMQGACAHNGTTQTTNRTQTTDRLLQDLEIKFNPLPLSIISPIN